MGAECPARSQGAPTLRIDGIRDMEPGGSLRKMETWVIFVEHCSFPDTMADTSFMLIHLVLLILISDP